MDILNFDDEQNILNFLMIHIGRTLLLKGNSFERKLFRYIQNINLFSSNNGHSDLPPDYYSDELSVMFDVLRVNDTEVKKTYNPLKMEERKMRNLAKEQELLDLPNIMPVIEVDEPDDVNAHTYQKYRKQAHRTIAEHIRKIPLWVKEHPSIKHKGLLVFDETEFCLEGFIASVGNGQFLYQYKFPLVIHESWNDENFFKQIYESDLDFVIWFCPYKPYGKIPMKHGINYPAVVIVDTRFPRTNYKKYNYDSLIM